MSEPGPADQGEGRTSTWLALAVRFLVALVAALPISVLLWSRLPLPVLPIVAGISLGRLLVFLLVLGLLIFLLRKWALLAYGLLVVGLGWITVMDFRGKYGFGDLYQDYGLMLSSISQRTEALPEVNDLKPFKGAEELRKAMDYKDPEVRSFAVRAATTWFTEAAENEADRKLVQAFSVFKVINNAWVYVSDPADGEYFATAKESVPLLAGDCDDHAVLMASAITAIGGKVRLVRTTGHIYPELFVGDAKGMQRAAYLIRNVLFPDEARHADLYYHTDAEGGRWINLDYTRHYPGGPVMNEKIIGVLYV
ncbi:MAG: hypothetical protein JST38_18930 [Bacteroidetes bacterium]|nr:hypothetical protein [Bacteroidota bacterium]MBS1942944.1 hypothetical protein [Bacteroidota bacterium]